MLDAVIHCPAWMSLWWISQAHDPELTPLLSPMEHGQQLSEYLFMQPLSSVSSVLTLNLNITEPHEKINQYKLQVFNLFLHSFPSSWLRKLKDFGNRFHPDDRQCIEMVFSRRCWDLWRCKSYRGLCQSPCRGIRLTMQSGHGGHGYQLHTCAAGSDTIRGTPFISTE